MNCNIQQATREGTRPNNQDRLAHTSTEAALLLVVADGMGGYRDGALAASLAVKCVIEAFYAMATPTLDNPAAFIKQQIQLAHQAIQKLGHDDISANRPRTTLVMAIVQENMLYCAHAGDSRLYHFHNGLLNFCTVDHSIAQIHLQKSGLSLAALASHPDRHKLYNCLGGEQAPKISLNAPLPLADGDRILLCSDGLWSNLSVEKLSMILQSGTVEDTLPELMELAENSAGQNCDNISAIAVQWIDHAAAALDQQAISDEDTFLENINSLGNEIEQALAELESAMNDKQN